MRDLCPSFKDDLEIAATCPQHLVNFLLHLRYKPQRDYFRGCRQCPAFDSFDWVVWKPDSSCFLRLKRLVPRRVLCLAHPRSIDHLVRLRFVLKDIGLVVAGEDTRLSEVLAKIERLKPHCRQIFYEAKDVHHSFIRSFSMGFISYYLERMGPQSLHAEVDSMYKRETIKDGILAAWGGIWPHLDDQMPERRAVSEFVERSPWIHREHLEPKEYLRRLAKSKYLIAPAGMGVQSPKLAEAWLVRTVPIALRNPCLEDLRDAGYPFLLLERWSELTPDLLRSYETKRESINWPNVHDMLTVNYFKKQILNL